MQNLIKLLERISSMEGHVPQRCSFILLYYPVLMMLLILYTLKDLEEGIVKVFYETAADIADLPFGVTGHDEIFSNYEISGDTVLLIRKVRISLPPHIAKMY